MHCIDLQILHVSMHQSTVLVFRQYSHAMQLLQARRPHNLIPAEHAIHHHRHSAVLQTWTAPMGYGGQIFIVPEEVRSYDIKGKYRCACSCFALLVDDDHIQSLSSRNLNSLHTMLLSVLVG